MDYCLTMNTLSQYLNMLLTLLERHISARYVDEWSTNKHSCSLQKYTCNQQN